ncbi:hypothetical protein DYI25_07635 [Mesobacillus boroniphilus]|uniref:Uncharacterized protein n=1 Tax=Mesobacillus boroniphilus TaxID=308892 RepID=A0A944CK87_9BACI|nr:hypothetical protein [Mesobacillus boroniphilus]
MIRKAQAPWSAPTSAGGPTGKVVFDFIGRTEATRGARRWSWTILEVKFILSSLVIKESLQSKDSFYFTGKPLHISKTLRTLLVIDGFYIIIFS